MNVFEVIDKTGRRIRSTEKQMNHILRKHPQIANYQDEIIDTLINPLKITDYGLDEDVRYYYKYLKNRISPEKYLLVVVKYLNGEGFIITAYFEKDIK